MKIEKIEKKLLSWVGQAIQDFQLISPQDKICVALSGGKDSWVLLRLLELLRRRSPVSFELLAFHVDQGYYDLDKAEIQNYQLDHMAYQIQISEMETYLKKHRYPYVIQKLNSSHIFDFSVSSKKDSSTLPCAPCARFRRGFLFRKSTEMGFNKLALGHHLDDSMETFLLNIFFTGRMAAMAAKMKADDYPITVIRPLIYASEEIVADYAKLCRFPLVPCPCPVSCEHPQAALSQRKKMKKLIRNLSEDIPQIRDSFRRGLQNIDPQKLYDLRLWSSS